MKPPATVLNLVSGLIANLLIEIEVSAVVFVRLHQTSDVLCSLHAHDLTIDDDVLAAAKSPCRSAA